MYLMYKADGSTFREEDEVGVFINLLCFLFANLILNNEDNNYNNSNNNNNIIFTASEA